jgi:hypothetical protein
VCVWRLCWLFPSLSIFSLPDFVSEVFEVVYVKNYLSFPRSSNPFLRLFRFSLSLLSSSLFQYPIIALLQYPIINHAYLIWYTAYEVYVACSLFFILSPDLCFGVRHFVKYLLLFRVVINQFLLFMPLASFFSFFVIFANTFRVYIVIRSISDNCYFNIRLSLYYNIRLSIMLI